MQTTASFRVYLAHTQYGILKVTLRIDFDNLQVQGKSQSGHTSRIFCRAYTLGRNPILWRKLHATDPRKTNVSFQCW